MIVFSHPKTRECVLRRAEAYLVVQMNHGADEGGGWNLKVEPDQRQGKRLLIDSPFNGIERNPAKSWLFTRTVSSTA